jgi:tRNA/tmRNA/rRNA uracil-C5-methylase (TrmA/RlmC/RlmD family)
VENNETINNSIKISNFHLADAIKLMQESTNLSTKPLTKPSTNPSALYKLFQIEPKTKLTLFLANSDNELSNHIQIHIVMSDNELIKNDLFDDDEIKEIIKRLNNEFKSLFFHSQFNSENIIINESIRLKQFDSSECKQLFIKRHLHSFYQTEEFMREKIHSLINNYIYKIYAHNNKKIFSSGIFLGGEMYIYGNLFDELFEKKIYITDTESIYLDAMLNDMSTSGSSVDAFSVARKQSHKSKYILTSYKTNNFLIDLFQTTNTNVDFLISNISKTGLGENICKQISQLKPKYLILITCNFKVTMRDFELLKKYANYNLINIIKLKTTYDTYISMLVY